MDEEDKLVFEKMETKVLSKQDLVVVKKVFSRQAENFRICLHDPLIQAEEPASDLSVPQISPRGAKAQKKAEKQGTKC